MGSSPAALAISSWLMIWLFLFTLAFGVFAEDPAT
jgi:hypothetical protein